MNDTVIPYDFLDGIYIGSIKGLEVQDLVSLYQYDCLNRQGDYKTRITNDSYAPYTNFVDGITYYTFEKPEYLDDVAVHLVVQNLDIKRPSDNQITLAQGKARKRCRKLHELTRVINKMKRRHFFILQGEKIKINFT